MLCKGKKVSVFIPTYHEYGHLRAWWEFLDWFDDYHTDDNLLVVLGDESSPLLLQSKEQSPLLRWIYHLINIPFQLWNASWYMLAPIIFLSIPIFLCLIWWKIRLLDYLVKCPRSKLVVSLTNFCTSCHEWNYKYNYHSFLITQQPWPSFSRKKTKLLREKIHLFL